MSYERMKRMKCGSDVDGVTLKSKHLKYILFSNM